MIVTRTDETVVAVHAVADPVETSKRAAAIAGQIGDAAARLREDL